jgi:hypothetical protein
MWSTKRGHRRWTGPKRRGLAYLVLLLGFLQRQQAGAGENARGPSLTVLVYNYADVSHATLERAERQADAIFYKGGFRLIWFDCYPAIATAGEGCRRRIEPSDLRLRIVSAGGKDGTQDSVFGFAVAPALATVYYEPARRLRKTEFETAVILGGVMAHEIGHLLLGAGGHSATGIMQPHWYPSQIHSLMVGTLQFTADEFKVMRAGVERRQ